MPMYKFLVEATAEAVEPSNEENLSRDLSVGLYKIFIQSTYKNKTRPRTTITIIAIQGRVSSRGTTLITSHLTGFYLPKRLSSQCSEVMASSVHIYNNTRKMT